MLVSHGKEQHACRLVMLPDVRPGHSEWLNASDDGILEFAGDPGPAARPGFSLVADGARDLAFNFPDGARWVFTLARPDRTNADAPEQWYPRRPPGRRRRPARCDAPHAVAGKIRIPRVAAAPPPPDAKSKRQRHGMISAVFQPPPVPAATAFDINAIDWTSVQSRLAWLNATSANQSLSISGHTVFRQIKAGSLAPFAPWPDGGFSCQSRANPGGLTGEHTFRLAKAGNAVLVSIARKNQSARLVHVHAIDSPAPRGGKKSVPARLRLLNAFPSGRLTLTTKDGPLTLDSGETSQPLDPARDLPQAPVLSGLTLTPPGGTARLLIVPRPTSPPRPTGCSSSSSTRSTPRPTAPPGSTWPTPASSPRTTSLPRRDPSLGLPLSALSKRIDHADAAVVLAVIQVL